jgi:DNA-binding beta-propeller fold protein YncE
MKSRNLLLVLCFAVITSSIAQSQPPLYRQTHKFNLGGEGGWDYVTYDPDGNRVFIAHGMSVLVADADTGKQLGTLPATGAHGVALVPKSQRGFLTNGRAGTVTVFDLKTLQPIGDIKVGENPDAIIYDSYANAVVVMHGRSKDVMVIDPGTTKVIATTPIGGKLEFAAADHDHVYVNVEDTGEIAVLDAKTWKLATRWKLTDCEEPSGLAINEAAGHLYTVCGNKKMLVVDSKTGAILAAVPTGDGTDAAAYDSSLGNALASNGEGTLSVVRRGANGRYELAGNVPTQRGARTMALDGKSHRVFLVTADLGPPAEGQRRPSILPGTFTLLVYEPVK